jgi:short-subunit dehydrogenase
MTNILITGASSGLGAALARTYAGKDTHLCIMGRNAVRLANVAAEIASCGAGCEQAVADVLDEAVLREAIEAYDAAHPVDLAIINAGIFDGRKEGQDLEDLETSLRVIENNLKGALNTLHAILPAMRARRSGHIVFITSLAGLTPLGCALGYSASKSAMVSYALGLKQVLHGSGIRVTTVCPGFIETPLADQHLGWQPFKITADKAAEKIKRGIASRRAIVAFPFVLHALARPSILVPDIVRRAVGKVFACAAGADVRGTGPGISGAAGPMPGPAE